MMLCQIAFLVINNSLNIFTRRSVRTYFYFSGIVLEADPGNCHPAAVASVELDYANLCMTRVAGWINSRTNT